MGSPISGTMAEIFLQHIENTLVKHLLDTNLILFYARYVDDILIVYDSTLTSPDLITHYSNSIHSCLKFTPTMEKNKSLSFLDLLITRNPPRLEINISRKPTTTDTSLNFLSNHPLEHKLAAYRFHIERMFSLPLSDQQQRHEWMYIKLMARNNGLPLPLLSKLKHRIQQKQKQNSYPTPVKKNNYKWATFTYSTPLIRRVTNVFKHTNLRISYRSRNSLQQLLNPTPKPQSIPYNRSGVYALSCNTCNLKYIAQTSQSLKFRYQEHIRYIRNNDPRSAYALHILQNRHEYGPMNSTMHLIKPITNPSLLLPYEQLHITDLSKRGQLIPEQNSYDSNPLVSLVLSPSTNPRKAQPVE